MSQTEVAVPSVKGIPSPAQARSCLELAVSRVLDGKHMLVSRRLSQGKRLPFPIAFCLHVLQLLRGVRHE
jgi:hypothetical protein